MSDEGGSAEIDLVAARLGADRAVRLRTELAAHHLEIIDRAALDELVSQAEGFQRMKALVIDPEHLGPQG